MQAESETQSQITLSIIIKNDDDPSIAQMVPNVIWILSIFIYLCLQYDIQYLHCLRKKR